MRTSKTKGLTVKKVNLIKQKKLLKHKTFSEQSTQQIPKRSAAKKLKLVKQNKLQKIRTTHKTKIDKFTKKTRR